jgi:lipopolysaccharide/colanic/teichoic acid biosynthesis glycosyltransferase
VSAPAQVGPSPSGDGPVPFVPAVRAYPGIVARYEGWQHARHLVRPGVTGWWQTSGRSSLPMHENTELDIYYVEHVSLWLDIRILLRTILAVTRSHGAY